jgi:glycosyltransferase involved in cell wall biosynthesis
VIDSAGLILSRRTSSDIAAPRVAVVIPAFKVKKQILSVIRTIGDEVHTVYVVDDKCPEETGRFVEREADDSRVRVIYHAANRGVGGAVITGIEAALRDQMQIVVKVDGDGQMDPLLIPQFLQPIIEGTADFAKGNRFFDPDSVRTMPAARLFGNAMLSFLTKLSSGYWNLFDPTNGFIAWDCRLLAMLPLNKIAARYFFESDLLFRISLFRAKGVDIPMIAVYGAEKSNLDETEVIIPFLLGNLRNFAKRICYNYFLRDFNVASLQLVLGLMLSLFGFCYGLAYWGMNTPATAGRVMIAALPLLTGVFLLLSFVNFDIQQIPREPISPRLGRRYSPSPSISPDDV